MITYEKINNTHFNILKDGKTIFSGSINQYVLLKGGFDNKSIIIKSLSTDSKIEIKISDTAETSMNNFMTELATVVFDSYLAPVSVGTDYIYDSLSCFSMSKNKYAIDMIALKGSLNFEKNNVFGKSVISFKTLKGDSVSTLSMSFIESLTLFNDDVKSKLLINSSIKDNFLYKKIEISAAEFLNCGNSPIELLPPLTSNEYYEYEIDFKYIGGDASYTTNHVVIYTGVTRHSIVNSRSFGKKVNWSLNLKGYNPSSVSISVPVITGSSTHIGQSVTLGTIDSGNPSNGDGIFELIIKYKINSFI